ncbi:hypothetical protein RUND412_009315 [Rhizina undulata]
MSADPVQNFFAQKKPEHGPIVYEAPKLDIENYISNYRGRTQIDRLLHIANSCPPLCIEAVKLALKLLKQTTDVIRYKSTINILKEVSPQDPEAAGDEWIEKTTRKLASDNEKIEAALKSYKHNLIKESIRMGQEDLGNHYYAAGDLQNAFKCYSRMRDFCTVPRHILDMSLQIIRVCIEQGNYISVQSHIVKIKHLLSPTSEEDELLKPKLCAAMGLTYLANRSYKQAAKSFLECPSTLGSSYNDVISANDVAIYGGLCSLASMDRAQLKSEVLDNNEFRNFLELEPHMRRAIQYFHTAKYSNCLEILESYKNDYLLDIHLHKHVEKLYDMIRSKGIVQYFVPFSCVTLGSMAEAFKTSEEQLQKELVEMIQKGLLQARIDTKNRLLVAKETNLRTVVHRDTLAMAQDYERTARMRLLRMNIIRAGLEVKGPKVQNTSQPGSGWGQVLGGPARREGGFAGSHN